MKKLLIVLLFPLAVFGQNHARLASSASIPRLENASSIFQHRTQFDAFRLQNDLSKMRGWKWAKRQEDEVYRRVDANGELPSGRAYLDAFDQVEAMKIQSPNAKMGDAGWLPVGPYGNADNTRLGRVNCIAFHPKDAKVFYVGFAQGGIWKTTNEGQSYTPLTDNLPITRVAGITVDPSNPETVYAAICDFAYIGYDLYTAGRKRNSHFGIGLYKTTDGGKNWKPTGLSFKLTDFTGSLMRRILVNPKNSQEVVVTSTNGIYKSKNGGDSFTKTYDSMTSDLDQDPVNQNVLYATGLYVNSIKSGKANILKSEDYGDTWKELTTGIEPTLAQRIELSIAATNPQRIYAVSCDLNGLLYGFFRSDDAGKTWTKTASRSQKSINLLGDGSIYFYPKDISEADDYGYSQGLYDQTILADPKNPDKVIVAGLTTMVSEDAGKTWIPESDYGGNTHPDIHYYAYNPLNQRFYNCNDGGLFSTLEVKANRKTTWKVEATGINATSFYRLGFSETDNSLIAGAQDNSSHLFKNGVWDEVYGGDGMECLVNPNGTNGYYASYQYGNISAFYKKTSTSAETAIEVFNPGRFREVSEWTTPYVFDAKSKEIIVAAGNVYAIPLYSDYKTARKLSNFSNIPELVAPNPSSALVISKEKPSNMYVAKVANPITSRKSELWKTANGSTFLNITSSSLPNDSYLSYLAMDDAKPEYVWACYSNWTDGKKIFASKDAGATWTNISYNLPNIPVNCIVLDQQTKTLYVGMDIGVYTLKLNDTKWQVYNTNLPNVIVSELEIDPRTHTLYAATFGRGVWKSDISEILLSNTEPIEQQSITVYPNPVKSQFTVKTDTQKNAQLTLVDVMGKPIFQTNATKEELQEGKVIDAKNLSSGLYFLSIEQEGKTKVLKVLKGEDK